jgi:hypothetical protein
MDRRIWFRFSKKFECPHLQDGQSRNFGTPLHKVGLYGCIADFRRSNDSRRVHPSQEMAHHLPDTFPSQFHLNFSIALRTFSENLLGDVSNRYFNRSNRSILSLFQLFLWNFLRECVGARLAHSRGAGGQSRIVVPPEGGSPSLSGGESTCLNIDRQVNYVSKSTRRR